MRRSLESWWRQPTFRRVCADHLSLRPRARWVLVWVTVWQPPTTDLLCTGSNHVTSKFTININAQAWYVLNLYIYIFLRYHQILRMASEKRCFKFLLNTIHVRKNTNMNSSAAIPIRPVGKFCSQENLEMNDAISLNKKEIAHSVECSYRVEWRTIGWAHRIEESPIAKERRRLLGFCV